MKLKTLTKTTRTKFAKLMANKSFLQSHFLLEVKFDAKFTLMLSSYYSTNHPGSDRECCVDIIVTIHSILYHDMLCLSCYVLLFYTMSLHIIPYTHLYIYEHMYVYIHVCIYMNKLQWICIRNTKTICSKNALNGPICQPGDILFSQTVC